VSQISIVVELCPANLLREALELVLRDLAPEHRHEIAAQSVGDGESNRSAGGPLMSARRGTELCGAAWGQLQPGKTAIYWVPQLSTQAAGDADIANRLTQAVTEALDAVGVDLTQTLLVDGSAPAARTLESAGFIYLAELLYLAGESTSVSSGPEHRENLEFVVYDDSQRGRLVALLERTYLNSRDCAAMNGKRQMDDVLDGYRTTGVYRPENWMFVRSGKQDVGVLLLADEPAAGHCELVYMGLVPEARGHGYGVQIAQHALCLAERMSAERVVLAVDAANEPAVAMYSEAGFMMWDRRTVYVRYRGGKK
jgi:GNAT superfamily N-acetyltransferase